MTATVLETRTEVPAELAPPDLLCTGAELAARLPETVRARQWLDAYLLAAGLSQLVDDRLHPDPLSLRRAAGYLAGRPSRPARVAGVLAAGLAAVLAVRRFGPRARRLLRAREDVRGLVEGLAALVMDPCHAPALRALPDLTALAELGADVVRIPACFRSFDQHPDDVRWLVDEYLERHGRPDVPLCVVGVRTSGCYLAPLHAAALRAAGATRVAVRTVRPGHPFLRRDKSLLRAVARAGGRVLVTDDPPGSGRSLAAACTAVAAAGVPDDAIVVLLSLFADAGAAPATLDRWRSVAQPWPHWSIHRRLAAEHLATVLGGMLGAEVRVLGRPHVTAVEKRGHLRARCTVEVGGPGSAQRREIAVEGAGLGYLGRQALAVAAALPARLPHVYGFADGLLVREWLPEPCPLPPAAAADVVARYVRERSAALRVERDRTGRLRGRDPVWEVAAASLAAPFGPLGPAARRALLEPLSRRLLASGQHCVVDGDTAVGKWVGTRKVDFHQRAFHHFELACYDPVFDLAGAAADPPSAGFGDLLRTRYRALGGGEVDDERWLLYRLAQLRRAERTGELDARTVAMRSADAVYDYLAACFPKPPGDGDGGVCVLDLDGVMEHDRLGFPAATPAAVLSVRALQAHGYRPVLASGRSLAEVRSRCRALGLDGGIAEYGTVIYTADGAVTDLRSDAARAAIGRVRAELARTPDVEVHGGYEHSVRASYRGGPLPDSMTALFAGGALRVISGDSQTDVTPARPDKGDGLDALLHALGGESCVLAVGDTAADLPLFARARIARAPSNACGAVRAAGITMTRRPYQAGLLEACAALLGHAPGHCERCRPPRHEPRTRALLAALAVAESGSAGLPVRAGRLAALLGGMPR